MRPCDEAGWPVLLAVFCCLSPGLGDATAVDEVLVTGTRLAAGERLLPGTSTVITRAEIERRNDPGVVDLLREVPGMQVTQPGPGGVPQVFIRGGEPNFTLFLVDGIRVNDPNNTRGGSFDLAALNLTDIERIEIVRGPQSPIYGSDGLAGVIHVITRRPGDRVAAWVEAEGGAEDFARGAAGISGPAGPAGFSLQVATRDDGEPVPGSTYEADSLSVRLRFEPRAGRRAGLYAWASSTEGTSFPEQSGGPLYAALRELDHSRADDYTVGGDFDLALTNVWSVQGLASLYEREDEYFSPGILPFDVIPPRGAENDLTRTNASLRATARAGANLVTTVGVDFQHESGDAVGYVQFGPDRIPNNFRLERDTLGVFAEARLAVTDVLGIQASVRHDEPDEESGQTTGKAGFVYHLNGGPTLLRANWGTGFKLPSFFALGSPIVGSPDLRPEKSRSLDAGIVRTIGTAGEVGVTLFRNRYEDLIDLEPETFRNINRDTVTARGVELSGSRPLGSSLSLSAHATWTDIEIEGSDRVFLLRPDWRVGAQLHWVPADRWRVHVAWLYIDDSTDYVVPAGEVELDGYHRVDLATSWQATARLRLSLAIDNLLDSSYEEAWGFPAAGFHPRLTVRYGFGE